MGIKVDELRAEYRRRKEGEAETENGAVSSEEDYFLGYLQKQTKDEGEGRAHGRELVKTALASGLGHIRSSTRQARDS